MRIDIEWHGVTTEADLIDGVISAGGGEHDGIRFEGLPAGLVELNVTGNTHLSVTAKCTVTIGEVRFTPHVPRLVLEGDTVMLLDGVILRRPAVLVTAERRQNMGTAFVAKSLFSGKGLPMVETRAATLTCVSGVDWGTTFALAFSEVIVGRADEADVRLHDRSVSRRHAKLTRRGPRFTIEPCQATNGLFVNGKSTACRISLNSGDVFELGQTVIRFDGPQDAVEDVTVLVPDEPLRVTVDESAFAPAQALAALRPAATPRAKPLTTGSFLMGLGVALTICGAAVLFFVALWVP